MKKILLLALPLMVMCFASCEKDNGKENDGKTEQKLVKSISLTEYTEKSFEYDKNGRVIRTKLTIGSIDYWSMTDIVYKDNMIIETITDNDNDMDNDNDPEAEIKREIIYHLDDNGYVINAEEKWYYSDETKNRTYGYTLEYENGKLVTIKDIDNTSAICTFQWQENDITTVSDYSITYFAYSNIVDIHNIDFSAVFSDGAYGITRAILGESWLKFKGTTSEHLPQMIDEMGVSYEFDDDGYVKTVKLKSPDEDEETIIYIKYVE